MILQALARYYDQLVEEGVEGVPKPGWCSRNIGALISLSNDGELLGIIPSEEKRGWKRNVPDQTKRSSGISANLLCDTPAYILGFDGKGKPDRAIKCFRASQQKHVSFLEGVASPSAHAIMRFFEKWNPEQALDNSIIQSYQDLLIKGPNLAFAVNGEEVLEDQSIKDAVEAQASSNDDAPIMTCLVDGKEAPIARLHPNIKGLIGAQSSGAALVSFNDSAFESYGCNGDQGLNAPVSEYVAFAYTTALNYLLADPTHHIRIADTTIVYWAERDDVKCSSFFAESIVGGFNMQRPGSDGNLSAKGGVKGEESSDNTLDTIMKAIESGEYADIVDIDTPFYVLGLSPNAARVAVRFFYTDSIGNIMTNIADHYRRLQICHYEKQRKYLLPYRLIKETENSNAKQGAASSILCGALMRSILSNSSYPKALYENTLLRIYATQNNDEKHMKKVSYERAAIVKAVLIKNYGLSEEEITVKLNLERDTAAYSLGRMFALYERIQEYVAFLDERRINATIFDKYFNAALTTPAAVFPVVMKASIPYLTKLRKKGKNKSFEKQLGELMERVGHVPKRLTMEEQGDFIIGYWCQKQEFFNSKDSDQEGEE